MLRIELVAPSAPAPVVPVNPPEEAKAHTHPEPPSLPPSEADMAMLSFDICSQLFYALVNDTCTPEMMEGMKKRLSPAQVQEVVNQVKAMTPEQRKEAIEYSKKYR